MPDDKLMRADAPRIGAPMAPARPVAPPRRPPRDVRIVVVAAVLLASVLWAARAAPWTPGSDVGYALGAAGGSALLLLLAYPLRKRLRFMQRLGRMRGWFALHMTLGIGAPLLVILHSTLAFGSINATVAFAVMALVATSGFVGRFLYARIHHGLYGEKASLAQLRGAASDDAEALHGPLRMPPDVVARLEAFAARADVASGGGLARGLAVATLGARGLGVRLACRRALRAAVAEEAARRGWDRAKTARRLARRRALVDRYVATAVRVGQFAAFERLFAWWHVLHVPLVWLLVASVVAHVVAVHMY
jgi:hypothetical protein